MSEELDCHDFFFHAVNFMPNSQSRNESCFCWEVGVAHSHHNTKPCCALSQESFQPSHITAAAHCTSGCGEWCQQLSFASPSSLASSERWKSMTGGGGICCSDLSESCHPFHPVRHKARTSRASHLPPLPGPRRFLAWLPWKRLEFKVIEEVRKPWIGTWRQQQRMPLYLSKHLWIFTFVTTVDRPISAERKKGDWGRRKVTLKFSRAIPLSRPVMQHAWVWSIGGELFRLNAGQSRHPVKWTALQCSAAWVWSIGGDFFRLIGK